MRDETIRFKDKRNRNWELFSDLCYYNMICVRCIDCGREFDGHMSFHFNTMEEAEIFKGLLEIAC